MPDIAQKTRRIVSILLRLSPLVSFIAPFLLLYLTQDSAYPNYTGFYHTDTFEIMWKGRAFYIFFLWLVSLETILGWEEIQRSNITKLRSVRTAAFIVALSLPTIYITVSDYCGLNHAIESFAKNYIQAEFTFFMPLSIEYLVLTVLFALIVSLAYGIKRIKEFAISTLFLGAIGIIFTIDNLYPYGRFTPFQIFVPTTTGLAANVLNMMGYGTSMSFRNDPQYGSLTFLQVWDAHAPQRSTYFNIAWVCSGVESLLLYSIVILLFLKKSPIPWIHRSVYFIVGATVTYFINVLRIVTIFVISINTGGGWTPEVERFHNYYAQLYSITWIMSYPLIIIGSRLLWNKIKNRRNETKNIAKGP
jgi:thaumarchaeosortase